METVFLTSVQKIKKLKTSLEKALDIKLEFNADNVTVSGKKEEGITEYVARLVLEAIDLGFDADSALQLRSPKFMLERINLKDFVRQNRLRAVKGRVIGKAGKAKKVISELSECAIVVKDNIIGILGEVDKVAIATQAMMSLIRGSPHSTVYSFLERARAKEKEKELIGEGEG